MEPGSLEANLNFTLRLAWLILRLRIDVSGGVTSGAGPAGGGLGVTVGVATGAGPAVTVGVGKAMTCVRGNEAADCAWRSPPALVKFPAA